MLHIRVPSRHGRIYFRMIFITQNIRDQAPSFCLVAMLFVQGSPLLVHYFSYKFEREKPVYQVVSEKKTSNGLKTHKTRFQCTIVNMYHHFVGFGDVFVHFGSLLPSCSNLQFAYLEVQYRRHPARSSVV